MDTYSTINRERIEQAEDHRAMIEAKTATMTLVEITAALLRLPASPETDNDLIDRATLTQRRLELEAAEAERRRIEAAAMAPEESGLCDVMIPIELGAVAVASPTVPGKFYYPTQREDGRFTIRLPWSGFHALAFGINGTAGPNGANWLAENPNLAQRLPRNPPPPAAG
ncbi:hypothetical protein [Bradyrhizobium sp. 6(2017)]|uniref:hypothetical protein n=1 Tax=Bradyrhizobium sp. 6(2017) TaxID=1197460 RepID=UPI0013E18FD2|nr:hypothetical protein [Bradyrhizobium sp. 6(2017)]QIG94417.1 hypothetical protein G6P99_19345 [Bradyrhizobium sp. 6(2017)]